MNRPSTLMIISFVGVILVFVLSNEQSHKKQPKRQSQQETSSVGNAGNGNLKKAPKDLGLGPKVDDKEVKIPHWTTQFQSIVTGLAIIFGGLWAWYKWGFQEWLRAKREIPALDGSLSFTSQSLSESKCILCLEMIWRNVGVDPISLDVARTKVTVQKLPPTLQGNGVVRSKSDQMESVSATNPHDNLSKCVLEPKTESVMHENVIVESHSVFFVQWFIKQENTPKHNAGEWSRELIVSSVIKPTKMANNKCDVHEAAASGWTPFTFESPMTTPRHYEIVLQFNCQRSSCRLLASAIWSALPVIWPLVVVFL